MGEIHVDFATVWLDAPRLLRRETEQLLQRGTRTSTRAELEHLAEQHERDDDRGCLEVEADLAAVTAERRRKIVGASVATMLKPNATSTPRPISVHMFGLRFFNDWTNRT